MICHPHPQKKKKDLSSWYSDKSEVSYLPGKLSLFYLVGVIELLHPFEVKDLPDWRKGYCIRPL